MPSHKKHRPGKDDSNEDSTFKSTECFGTYIEACIYGSDLSAFLEGTHMADTSELNIRHTDNTGNNNDEMIAENAYAGEESDHCEDGVPEDSEQDDSSEESVWLQTPQLDRYIMRQSNLYHWLSRWYKCYIMYRVCSRADSRGV